VANHLGAHKPLVQVRAIFLCSFVEKSGIVMKYRPKKPENRDSIPDSISTGSKKIIRQRVLITISAGPSEELHCFIKNKNRSLANDSLQSSNIFNPFYGLAITNINRFGSAMKIRQSNKSY